MKKIFISLILALFLTTLFAWSADAVVKVKGYIKKNGTVVQPYYRSNPDSNPYNNWSYPGNTNPYTGETATGDPNTYLKNYSNNSISIPAIPAPSISTSTVPPITPYKYTAKDLLKAGDIVKTDSSNDLYYYGGGLFKQDPINAPS